MLLLVMLGGIGSWISNNLSPTNPIKAITDAVDYIGGFATSVGNDVKEYVKTVVQWAIDLLERLIDWLSNGLDYTTSLLVEAVNAARALGQAAVDSADDIIRNKIPGAVSWAIGIVGDVRDELLGLLATLRRDAFDALAFVGGVFHGLDDWVRNHAIPDIWGWINGAFAWVYGNLVLPVLQQASAWYHEVLDLATSIAADVDRAAHWIANYAVPWLALVERAGVWLTWFALHPFDSLESIVGDVLRRAPHVILDGAAAAMAQHGDRVDDLIVQWLGG